LVITILILWLIAVYLLGILYRILRWMNFNARQYHMVINEIDQDFDFPKEIRKSLWRSWFYNQHDKHIDKQMNRAKSTYKKWKKR